MLDFDLSAATIELCRRDRELARVVELAGPCTLSPPPLQSPFQALLRAIVYQQLSGKAAATIYGRLAALCPGRRGPQPQQILDLPEEAIRAAGLSRAKTLAVRDLAAQTQAGVVPTLARLKRLPDEEIVNRLVQVRGVGRWTVEMLLIFRLGRPDVLPVSDLGVRRGFMLTYGLQELPHVDDLTAHAERWRPFRSVASWYMWRATEQLVP